VYPPLITMYPFSGLLSWVTLIPESVAFTLINEPSLKQIEFLALTPLKTALGTVTEPLANLISFLDLIASE